MPYGLKNETPKQTSWMEKCVKSVTKSNPDYDKSRAIAICKIQLKKKGKSEEWMEEEVSEVSLREIEDMFYKALNDNTMTPQPSSYAYPVDIFDDYVIISKGDKYFKVPYTMSDNELNVNWDKSVEVEKKTTYEAVSWQDSNKSAIKRRISHGGVVRNRN